MKIESAGLLMYRIMDNGPEVFLIHPGGPFFKNKDEGCWSFPKGELNNDEDKLEAAKREFEEETSFKVPEVEFINLGKVKKPSKTVYVWAFEGDCDPSKMKSNTCMVEWPPRSGKQIEIPEADRGDFFDLETARVKLTGYLKPIIDKFIENVSLPPSR
jgi:predicted NUDIX family NTP pyrophosphohydrolase